MKVEKINNFSQLVDQPDLVGKITYKLTEEYLQAQSKIIDKALETWEIKKEDLLEALKYKERWCLLKQKVIDYRFNKTGSHLDGRYCVSISVTDLLKWMKELEGEKNDARKMFNNK